MADLPELQFEDDLPSLQFEDSKPSSNLEVLKSRFSSTPENRQAAGTLFSLARGIPFMKRIISISSGVPLEEVNRTIRELEPKPQGIGEQLQKGVGETALTLSLANPFLKGAGMITQIPKWLRPAAGFGAFEGAKALSQGDEPIGPAISGAGSALAFGAGGRLGASLVPRGVPFAETLGSILGGAGVGKVMSPEDPTSTILGAGFGAISPSKRVPLSSFGKSFGRGVSSISGVKPEVFQEVEQRGFRKVLQEKYYDRKMPEILQERIEGNLDALEKGAVGKFDEATAPLRKTKVDWAQIRGEVIKAYNKVKLNPFKGESKQLNDYIAEGVVNTDAKNLGEVLDLRRFLSEELFTKNRQGVKSKFGREVYDIFNKYLHQNETLKQADAEWTTLQNILKESKKLTGETGENFLKRFSSLTGKQKESLALLEKQIGGEPFIEDLTNWSLAKEYGTRTSSFNFNPFTGFGLLTKVERPLARGYLRGTEAVGKGLDIGQEKLNVGSERLRSNLKRTLANEKGSVNLPTGEGKVNIFGEPTTELGNAIINKLGINYEKIKLVGEHSKNIGERRDARAILRIVSDRIEEPYKLQKLAEFQPESDLFKKAIFPTPTEQKGFTFSKSLIAPAAVGLGTLGYNQFAQAAQPKPLTDLDGIKAILGEAEADGKEGMQKVGEVLRRRGSLKGVYGYNAIVTQGDKWFRKNSKTGVLMPISTQSVADAYSAWKDSATSNDTKDAMNWQSPEDLKKSRWDKSPRFTVTHRFKGHTFLKENK